MTSFFRHVFSNLQSPSIKINGSRGRGVLQEANGNMPLDGVAFSIELLEWGRTFRIFLVKTSSYQRLAND